MIRVRVIHPSVRIGRHRYTSVSIDITAPKAARARAAPKKCSPFSTIFHPPPPPYRRHRHSKQMRLVSVANAIAFIVEASEDKGPDLANAICRLLSDETHGLLQQASDLVVFPPSVAWVIDAGAAGVASGSLDDYIADQYPEEDDHIASVNLAQLGSLPLTM